EIQDAVVQVGGNVGPLWRGQLRQDDAAVLQSLFSAHDVNFLSSFGPPWRRTAACSCHAFAGPKPDWRHLWGLRPPPATPLPWRPPLPAPGWTAPPGWWRCPW